MRTLLLFPLAVGAAMLTAGCRSDTSSETGARAGDPIGLQPPARDLTLQQSHDAQIDVASPAELIRVPPPPARRSRPARRPPPAAQVEAVTAAPAPALAPAIAAGPVQLVTSEPETGADEPPDPHALPPGKSITVIPVSSGPHNGGDSPVPPPTGTDQRRGDPAAGAATPLGHPGGGCRGGGHSGGRGGGFRGLR